VDELITFDNSLTGLRYSIVYSSVNLAWFFDEFAEK